MMDNCIFEPRPDTDETTTDRRPVRQPCNGCYRPIGRTETAERGLCVECFESDIVAQYEAAQAQRMVAA